MNTRTRISTAILSVVGALLVISTTQATVITKTTTFTPGVFWADFTYGWSVTAQPADMPYNDVDIVLGDRTQINVGSYVGPGSAAIAAGAANTGTLRVSSTLGLPFPAAMTFTYDSVSNPAFVEGRQNVWLTLQGAPTSPILVASAGTPIDPFNPGDTVLAYDPGTFDPFANVDVFQNGHGVVHLGFGVAAADGSATVPLNEPLNANSALIGENGAIKFESSPIPEPTALIVWSLLGALGVTIGWWRRRRAA